MPPVLCGCCCVRVFAAYMWRMLLLAVAAALVVATAPAMPDPKLLPFIREACGTDCLRVYHGATICKAFCDWVDLLKPARIESLLQLAIGGRDLPLSFAVRDTVAQRMRVSSMDAIATAQFFEAQLGKVIEDINASKDEL